MRIHKKGKNKGNRENTRKGFKKNIQTTSQCCIHRDIDGNRNIAKNTICNIDVGS